MQTELDVSWEKTHQRIQDREKDMKVPQQELGAMDQCAYKVVRDSHEDLHSADLTHQEK